MHIGFVSPLYPPGLSANGISTYVALMAKELASEGHRVTVFSQGIADEASGDISTTNERIRVRYVTPRSFNVPLLRTAFYRIGRGLCPGYIQNRDPGLALRAAVRQADQEDALDVLECPEVRGLAGWAESLGIPVVVRLHAAKSVNAIANGESRTHLLRGIARAERRCLRRARFLTAPSHAIIPETERVLGIELADVRVIPNPFSSSQHERLGGEWGEGGREILFVGRLDLHKGFDLLIEAFKFLASKTDFSDVRLKVVGPDRGLLFDGRHPVPGAEWVRRCVPNEAVRSRINLVGPLGFDEVQALRRRAHITVVPSRFENFPYTLLEALAAGSAVVASDAGGISEVVGHERNGLLFRSGDWQDLAEKIERLLSDTELSDGLAGQGRADVEDRYAPSAVAQQTTQFFEEVVDRFRSNDARQASCYPAESLERGCR